MSRKKVTIIVEDDESIETTTFHVTKDIWGNLEYPCAPMRLDNGMTIDLPTLAETHVTFKFTTIFNPETNNHFTNEKVNKGE